MVSMFTVLVFTWMTAAAAATPTSDVLEDEVNLRDQLKMVSKQVTALLERRAEDLKSIEEHMRRKLTRSQELSDVREEIRNLRNDMDQLRVGGHRFHHGNQEKNDHLTLKWLSNAVSEVKLEVNEMQNTLNTTAILETRERVDAELVLLRTDVSNLNRELQDSRSREAKRAAEVEELREEYKALKEHSTTTAAMCGKTKNQLKAAQLEWNFNWKNLNDKDSEIPQSRHQRLLKKHVVGLEKTTKKLYSVNGELLQRVSKLEEELQKVQSGKSEEVSNELYDRINGNEVENYLRQHKINEIKPDVAEKLMNLEEQQRINTDALLNLTRQYGNFDKLHLSMLQLLENVETVEARVDKTVPEFRKEISMLESKMSEGLSKLAALREDQDNTRASMKAISVSVSNLQDKHEDYKSELQGLAQDFETVKKSSSVQTSKLHDHILKSESSTADVNATKSTIHLVQELKSFEKEYKSIVNKLPNDCGEVNGPNGVYLISPGDGEPILAYCSQGWTTIQKRYDGSVEFNRNWNDYSNGFGSPTGEHWLGNRNLHYLTKSNCTKLEINMKDIYGKYWQATYDDFKVADFANGFRLDVNRYSGNASDALDYQNRMEFSTVDNDRDISNTHCASNYEGGWWFSHCQHANLNGKYNLGLTWFDSSRNEWIAVATSEMRLKKRDVC